MAWMDQMTSTQAQLSGYWYQVNLVWTQWKGLYAGFSSTGKCKLSQTWLMAIGSQGDLFDLRSALIKQEDWTKMSRTEFRQFVRSKSHCSGLIKVTDDLSDLFFSHTAWFTYQATTRIFKHYKFNFNDRSTRSKLISFSSYPASLSSFDDFHVMDTGLVSIETTIVVYDYSLYNNNTIRPSLLLYWVRVIVANRMAKDAPDWADHFARYNSGTYNNQWMVVDLNKFTPGKPIVPNTLWVVEQIPGYVQSGDQSGVLQYGYWPSYNVPAYPNIFNALGYPKAIAQFGPDMNDYQTCVRANIFRRDQTTVHDLNSMQHIMQYNNYETDPLSKGDPEYAISSRADLIAGNGAECGGGYDNKVSSYSLFKQGMQILARSGPSSQQATFSYDTTRASCPHTVGLPRVYNFSYVLMKP
jgi:hypothetical protein